MHPRSASVVHRASWCSGGIAVSRSLVPRCTTVQSEVGRRYTTELVITRPSLSDGEPPLDTVVQSTMALRILSLCANQLIRFIWSAVSNPVAGRTDERGVCGRLIFIPDTPLPNERGLLRSLSTVTIVAIVKTMNDITKLEQRTSD